MKLSIYTATLSLLATSHLFADQGQDYIRQTNLDTGVTSDIYVDGPDGVGSESGSENSTVPINLHGVRYELYGITENTDGELRPILIDETVTGAIPNGFSSITSPDTSEVVITRTRADQSYYASMTFQNINTTSTEVSTASKYLYVERLISEYTEEASEQPIYNALNEDLKVVEAFIISSNGTIPPNGPLTQYTSLENSATASIRHGSEGEFVQKQKGEERIRIYALAGDDLTWYIKDEQRVHIWPEAHADDITYSSSGDSDMSEAVDGAVISGDPYFHINVHDLYPENQTWIRIYSGEADSTINQGNDIFFSVSTNYVVSDTQRITPQSLTNYVIPPNLISDLISTPGKYTIQVLTKTPFTDSPEILKDGTFEIPSNDLKIQGTITTFE